MLFVGTNGSRQALASYQRSCQILDGLLAALPLFAVRVGDARTALWRSSSGASTSYLPQSRCEQSAADAARPALPSPAWPGAASLRDHGGRPCHRFSTAASREQHYRERRLMYFSPKQVHAVVADVARYQEFVPWCQQSSITKQLSPHSFEADLRIGFHMFNERYSSTVTFKEPEYVRSTVDNSDLFDFLNTNWDLAQGPTPKTAWLNFSVEFSFKSVFHRQAANLFMDRVVKQMVYAFEHRCKEMYVKRRDGYRKSLDVF